VIRRDQDVSRSMVALVASLTALALLGLFTRVPHWLGRDGGFDDVEPGLLTVSQKAKGIATLGGGVSVSLYDDGLRITRGSDLLLQTVIGGAFLSAVEGSVTGSGDETEEDVQHDLSDVQVDELVFLPGLASYLGSVQGDGRRLPFTVRVELAGSVVRIGATVSGADAVVFHLDHVPDTVGIRPALQAENLRGRARWISPTAPAGQAAYRTMLGTDVGAGPQGVARGVDVRSRGRTDVHVWSEAAYLTVSSQARPRPSGG
jgi:hypothetical protein